MNILKSDKGFYSFLDSFLAIFIIIIIFLIFNSTITVNETNNLYEIKKTEKSQEVMESLSSKVNYSDFSVLEKIYFLLKSENNSKESILKSKEILSDNFKKINLKSNYLFTEENQINEDYIIKSGDIKKAENISVAKRNIGNYSFTLYLW